MKARLTITLDARLLARVDRAVPKMGSRSAVIEEAVRRWSRSDYEASIRAYYSARSQDEAHEDDAWAELSEGELAAVTARDARTLRDERGVRRTPGVRKTVTRGVQRGRIRARRR